MLGSAGQPVSCGLFCRFQRNVLDLSLQWRFANLPNNAKLEMVPISRSREGPENMVGGSQGVASDTAASGSCVQAVWAAGCFGMLSRREGLLQRSEEREGKRRPVCRARPCPHTHTAVWGSPVDWKGASSVFALTLSLGEVTCGLSAALAQPGDSGHRIALGASRGLWDVECSLVLGGGPHGPRLDHGPSL